MKKLLLLLILVAACYPQQVMPLLGNSSGGGTGGGVTSFFGPSCVETANNSTCQTTGTGQVIGGFAAAVQVTMGTHTAGYTPTACALYLTTVTPGNVNCAIYTVGGTLLCVAGAVSNTTITGYSADQWYELNATTPCASVTLSASTAYVVAVATDSSSNVHYTASGGAIGYSVISGVTMPSSLTWSTGFYYDAYVKVVSK